MEAKTTMIEHIQSTIEQAIPGARIAIVDPQNDGQHFEAYVVSASFEGMPLVRQHQMVLNSLKAEFAGNVAFVGTKDFYRPKEESPSGQSYHWNSNAETYFLIGDGMAKAMLALLNNGPQ
jgi:stress-induced morphogen